MIMLLYELLELIASVMFFLCLCAAVGYILCRNKQSFEDWSEQFQKNIFGLWGNIAKPFLILALLATLITNTAIHQLIGVHDLRLKPDGTYCFYVEASRFGGKTYTLPAQIRVETETIEVSENKDIKRVHYHIERVFFSNGGYLNTEDTDPVSIRGSCSYYDYDYDRNTEEEWELVLLNEHAYSPYVTESNNAAWSDVLLLVVKLSSISFTLYALCYRRKKKNL